MAQRLAVTHMSDTGRIYPDQRRVVAAHHSQAVNATTKEPAMESSRSSARAALRMYLVEPAAAQSLAQEAVEKGRQDEDWVGVAMALRVLGLVAGHLSDAGAAIAHFRKAMRFARLGDDQVCVARIRTDLAYVLSRQGKTAAALREIDTARPFLRGADKGRLLMMQALVLKSIGRQDDALEVYQRALPIIRRADDKQALAELLGNRGVIQVHRGALEKADRDLGEAAILFEEMGKGLHRAITLHNLGCIAALRGDVPQALARFDRAEIGYADHRDVPLELWRDRCELLLAAGLTHEARAAAERAVAIAADRGELGELAEARVRLAQAALAEGDKETALAESREAASTFTRQRRTAWSSLARWIAIQARLVEPRESVTSHAVRQASRHLQTAGFRSAAVDAALIAAGLAIEENRPHLARADLTAIAADRRSGLIWSRMQAWHAEALLRLLAEDRSGTRRAAARGLALVAEYRSSLGATDLQALASRRVSALAELGLRTAIEDGRPAVALSWAERTRAAHLLTPPTRPPDDTKLAREMAELRQVITLRREAVEHGRPEQPELISRQLALERAVRDHSRRVRTPERSAATQPANSDELTVALAGRALIEYLTSGDTLHAVTIIDGHKRLHHLGDVRTIRRQLQLLPFTLRRMARHGTSATAIEATLQALHKTAHDLEAFLVSPFINTLAGRPLVIVPTEPLQSLPWSVLPCCRGRSVTVAPSATIWARSAARADIGEQGHLLFAAGPGLAHAIPEVTTLAATYPAATVLVGADATAESLVRAMDGAGLVHIAAHGQFREDNPMFSSITAADGPVTVYDLERIPREPRQVILSACQSGRTASLPGGEVLGLASELLRIGVRTLVASVIDIPDAETESLMIDLHAGLTGGLPLAEALAKAQERAYSQESTNIAVAAGFLCFGAG